MATLVDTFYVQSYGADAGITTPVVRVLAGSGTPSVLADGTLLLYAGAVDPWFSRVRFQVGVTPVTHRRFNIAKGVSADFLLKLSFAGSGYTAVRFLLEGSGSSTESSDDAVILWGVDGWKRHHGHGLFRPYSGLEQTVILEGGVYRAWFTYVREVSNAPVSGLHYSESADGVTWSAPVALGSPVPDNRCRSNVLKGPDGVYHLFTTVQTPGHGPVEHYSSPSGNPGTWSLVNASLITNPVNPSALEMGNTKARYEGGTYYLMCEYASGTGWPCGLWSGATLASLTPYVGNPIMLGSRVHAFPKTGGGYVGFGHRPPTADGGGFLPTHMTFFDAPAMAGPWTYRHFALVGEPHFGTVTGFSGVIGGTGADTPYGGTATPDSWDSARAFTGESQLADAHLVETDGVTSIFYEAIEYQSDPPHLAFAEWPAPVARIADAAITHARGDDLPAEGWVFDAGCLETFEATPTYWFRKRSRLAQKNPVAIEVHGSVQARRTIAPGVDEIVQHVSLRAEQTNQAIDFKIEKVGAVALATVRLSAAGRIEILHGGGTADLGAYVAGTYYDLVLTLRSASFAVKLDGTTVQSGLAYQNAWARPAAWRFEQAGGESRIGSLILRVAPASQDPALLAPSALSAGILSMIEDTVTIGGSRPPGTTVTVT